MSIKRKVDFEYIVADILSNEKFKSLNNELHHGITRYEHSIRVARYTYCIAKTFRMNKCVETTRAALLHDFYNDKDLSDETSTQRLSSHPFVASQNAYKYFNIDNFQKDIIEVHMFPVTKKLPKTKESILVSLMDKVAAVYEIGNYKLALKLSMALIFIYNILTIER